ncbi:MAG: hypothetical protein NC123_18240 [Butyrivibrio sp.]|nr:hypothetical protein [Acetatifactor muris]MCM1561452.1 hypothetical protein [Butyrivibrio sp.]
MEADKEKVKEWMSGLAANCKELKEMEILEEGVYEICLPFPGKVHLYGCARKIAELLEIPLAEYDRQRSKGDKQHEVSFIYEDVEFFGLEVDYVGED